jgi:large subunit ribosomal protein L32
MAVPKKRISRTRRDRRRSHLRASIGQVSLCSHCKQPKLAHRLCPHCGYYAGVEMVQQEE